MIAPLIGHIDFHVHTIHSNCGKAGMTPSAVGRLFESNGYHAIGFTDHYDPVLTPEKIRQIKEELVEANLNLDIYLGTEACVYLPDWPVRELREFSSRHLDFCIMSPSHRPSSSEAPRFSKLPIDVQARRVLDSFIEAVRTNFADVIAHPFAYGKTQIPHLDEVLSRIDDANLKWALELARDNGIAMEFSPRVLGLNDSFVSRFVGLCKEVGNKFSIGGDAHSPGSIGNDKLVLPLLRRFRIGEDQIWFPKRR